MSEMMNRLYDAGLIRENSEGDTGNSVSDTPWYVKILHAFSGWMASVFLLLALNAMIGKLFDTPLIMFGLGLLLVGTSYLLLGSKENTLFLQHMALSISLSGQALVSFALFQWLDHPTPGTPLPWLGLAGMEMVLMIAMPDYLHRLFSAGVFAMAMIFGMHYLGAGALVIPLLLTSVVWLGLHEYDRPDVLFLRQSIGWGLSLALLWSAAWGHAVNRYIIFDHHREYVGLDHPWIAALLSGGVLIYLVFVLTQKSEDGGTQRLFLLLFAALVALLSVWMPGLSIALSLLILGFARGNLLLLGLSIVALLWATGHFYYALHTTLLIKSALLVGTGIALLILYTAFGYVVDNKEPS
jgi:hypothetical protein